jgi:sec-independent protein translocase protein TatC
MAAIFLALPVILYQAWMFVVPGLKETEARYAKSFVAAGTFFFFAGAWFCYAVIFRWAFRSFFPSTPTSASRPRSASASICRSPRAWCWRSD